MPSSKIYIVNFIIPKLVSFYILFILLHHSSLFYMEMTRILPLALHLRCDYSIICATLPLLSFIKKCIRWGSNPRISRQPFLRRPPQTTRARMLLYTYFLFLVLCPHPFPFFNKMHPVGFEPTHLSIAELKSAPLDHSGTNASCYLLFVYQRNMTAPLLHCTPAVIYYLTLFL